jgi:hypothetical protein
MPTAIRLAVLAACLLHAPSTARAETLDLAPRRAVGDFYSLSLATKHSSAFHPQGKRRAADTNEASLHYEADVAVLAVDERGRPVHERHVDVVLRATQGDETTSLFREPVAFDVRRDEDGDLTIHASDGRIDRKLEARLAELLATQFEASLAPALLDPGRDVALGETWTLDADMARRFLREQGIRAIDLDGNATATLATRDDGQALVLRYAIPVAWWKPHPLPKHATAGDSEARFEGEIELVADATLRPARHTTALTAEASGVVTATGYAAPAPWHLAMQTAQEERTRTVRRPVAANF